MDDPQRIARLAECSGLEESPEPDAIEGTIRAAGILTLVLASATAGVLLIYSAIVFGHAIWSAILGALGSAISSVTAPGG